MLSIENTIPHRPPFLFIDEIVDIQDNRAVGKRIVRSDEPQFTGHYPGNPIMPGVLLCEAAFQVGAVLLVERLRRRGESTAGKTPILARIREAKFKRVIRPGDHIVVAVDFEETLGKFHFLKGKITANGKVTLIVNFALALLAEGESSE